MNVYLLQRENSESNRVQAAAAIKMFYKRNDSPLFGDFKTSTQQMKTPAKALFPEDIRKILLSLRIRDRTPLLLMWQSGMEPSRVFNGNFPTDQAPPVRVDIYGRKMHRQPYFTFIGTESVEHLRLLGAGVRSFARIWVPPPLDGIVCWDSLVRKASSCRASTNLFSRSLMIHIGVRHRYR